MAESDDSEFGSVTSSQKSYLNHCPFADPNSVRPTQSSDGEVLETVSDNTEVLGNLISPPVVVTPVISYSSRTSVDSINDDVFRTPPENPSLSSAPDSQTRVRVSELRSPSSPVSASPSLPVVNVRVSEMTNRRSDSVEPLSSPSPVTAVDARVSVKHLDSSSFPGRIRVFENQPISDSEGVSRSLSLSSSSSSSSSSASATSGISFSESENEDPIPFKEIIEALVRNSGDERDKQVSYVNMLKQCGLKFP